MQQKLYWLDYDPVALAVLVIGLGMRRRQAAGGGRSLCRGGGPGLQSSGTFSVKSPWRLPASNRQVRPTR
jgi:hypothetical protein